MSGSSLGSVSVVVPVYNEEVTVPLLVARLERVLEGTARPYEIILVDDGSRDGSLALMRQLADRNPSRIRVVELSRNFGQHPALLAGFSIVSGDAIVTIDADLQNPPEEIPKLLALTDQGFDVVGGVRAERHDSIFRRGVSSAVNRVIGALTGIRMRDYGCMLRAYSREIVDLINRTEEHSTFLPALAQTFSRRPTEVVVAHAPRAAGESRYSAYRLIRLGFDLMTGFSMVPLQVVTLLGFATALGGVGFGIYLLVRRFILLRVSEAEGVFTLFALAFVVLGVVMAAIGIVGEYVGRIYLEVRGRPRYLVRRIYGQAGAPLRVADPGPGGAAGRG
ncbi:MAG TPA: glycosyltransferase [Gemmatimonadaceae bacterium]|nr:glycosyltransferase [Gemmatimonadaceae bacterium]